MGLSDDIAMLLADMPSLRREAFVDLVARSWERSPDVAASLQFLNAALLRLELEERDAFAVMAAEQADRFAQMFELAAASGIAGDWLASGGWRTFLPASDAWLEQRLERDALLAELAAAPYDELSTDTAMAKLRSWHKAPLVRIIYHDLLLHQPLESIVAEISTLADAAIQGAIDSAAQLLMPRIGTPVDEAGTRIPFCVLAMGKHGGSELNYASDIDLVFLYGADGETRGGPRPLEAAAYFAKLAELVIKLLSHATDKGSLYRVDMRLRPDGARGALVQSLESTLRYYRTRGATWERQALLKARPCAGDGTLGAQFMAEIESFVHRQFLSVSAIGEIKALKRRIEHAVDARDETWRDIKTGFGGIRDIEFVVQFLQLLNGGRHPDVRSPNTLNALAALAGAGCLRDAEAQRLADAYRFLRRVEHGLQLESGRQTHRLPDDAPALQALARRLGYRDSTQSASATLYDELRKVTVSARSLLIRLFTDLFPAETHDDETELVLNPGMDAARAHAILGRYGLADTARAFKLIQAMSEETPRFARYTPRARKYLASTLPAALDFVSRAPDPDLALANLERLSACIGGKSVFYELLAHQPGALKVFGSICSHSRYLIEAFESRAGLLDEFADHIMTWEPSGRRMLRAELDARTLAAADVSDALQWTRDLETLRIALFDVTARSDSTTTLEHLAVLAEVVLGGVVESVLRHERERFPDVRASHADLASRFAVIALGKFGSGAMSYGSDLDLVFVYDGEERAYFERVAFGIRKTLSETCGYDVDLRLRPRGSAGQVASSYAGLESYLTGEAEFWERLALTRARIVSGESSPFGLRIRGLLDRFLYEQPLPPDALAQTISMRQRMEAETTAADFKRGPGGLIDVEFLVELRQLEGGKDRAELRAPQTFAAMQAAQIPREMQDAYMLLRLVESRLQLLTRKAKAVWPQDAAELRVLARACGFEDVAAFEQRFATARADILKHCLQG